MSSCFLWEEVNIIVVKLISGDDGAHSTNEKLDLSNYISGILEWTADIDCRDQIARSLLTRDLCYQDRMNAMRWCWDIISQEIVHLVFNLFIIHRPEVGAMPAR